MPALFHLREPMQETTYTVDATLPEPIIVIWIAVGSILLLAMTSFAVFTLIRNRRRGGSV
jgi:hypothetical protein